VVTTEVFVVTTLYFTLRRRGLSPLDARHIGQMPAEQQANRPGGSRRPSKTSEEP